MSRIMSTSITAKWTMAVVMLVMALAWGQAVDPASPAGESSNWVVVRQALPTGSTSTSVLQIEQVLPREVKQSVPFDYRIRVTNLAECRVWDVTVLQVLPESVSLQASYPQARVNAQGESEWDLGVLAIGETRTIHARAVTQSVGALTLCCDATYRMPICATVQSTRPALALLLDAPPVVTRCEDIPVRITVSNTGSGVTSDVRITYAVPDGLNAGDNRRELTFRIPSLAPGTTRQATLRLTPTTVGTFRHRVTAFSAGGLRASAGDETLVNEPRLNVTQTGTARQFAGRNVTYTFAVTNTGDAVARNVLVRDDLPSDAQVISMEPANGTRLDGRVIWRLPQLNPGVTRDFSLTMLSTTAGTYRNRVTATADCAEDASASHQSVVEGIAAILLEVVDLDDPIEVGGQETYVITATNQGSAVGTNLRVRCVLEENMEYLSSDGPTEATVEGNVVLFEALPRLEPKQTATWRVICGAKSAGDVRFTVQLRSDQLERPVQETEATHLY